MQDRIVVKGAREHNLKNIDVELPRDKFIVITGLSGSGKSTLAFDTIYAEGQRRYVESLSAYARQFLGLMNKPDIDSIEGLSPAISIEQKTTSKNPRSTVGTVTEIYDYLRLLFARIGTPHCPKCDAPIKPQSAQNITDMLLADEGREVLILAPIIRGKKGTHEQVFERLKSEGFVRARVDGKIVRLDEFKPSLGRYEKHWIEAVLDRVVIEEDSRSRLAEAVEHSLEKGSGTMIVIDANASVAGLKEIERSKVESVFSSFGACPNHPEIVFEELQPRMFSFNSPFGACPECLGLGEKMEVDPGKIIPDASKSIADGAIRVYNRMDLSWRSQQIGAVGKEFGFDLFTPLEKFSKKQLETLLYGTSSPISAKWSSGAKMQMKEGWEGIIPQTMRLYRETDSDRRKQKYESFMSSRPCMACKGRRLKETILAVKIDGKSIIDATDLPISDALGFFEHLQLDEKELFIAHQVLKEIVDRLTFLRNVGLSYLTLSRSARTLSGGEAQRIRLATQIGANLMGVLYILDEPSIGLHQRDNEKLIATLKRLRDLGNTLIVVEHDEETMRAADHLVDMGPGAGIHGGRIVAQGTPAEIARCKKSTTGRYLAGKEKIEVPENRRKPRNFITLSSARENNLNDIDARFPTGTLCGVTGVSGSGKSSLMNQTLVPALQRHFGQSPSHVGMHGKLGVPDDIDSVIVIDQDPIGRTPRSNPATYTKVFDDIRKLFAQTKEARLRGYDPGRFSFNVKGGRCETCAGDGVIKIEMNFLPDVYVECEECKGKRYNRETLQVFYKGHTVADVLAMTVEEALAVFSNHASIARKLKTLADVGLGYIKLGQQATTLSGGESQRVKLTRELAKHKRGSTVYLLDEPTTGLHFEDVRKLLGVLNRLVDKGNTVYVIEHNLDVIRSCDYLIDLGPEGGNAGGEVIAEGTPEEVARNKISHTGAFLKRAG